MDTYGLPYGTMPTTKLVDQGLPQAPLSQSQPPSQPQQQHQHQHQPPQLHRHLKPQQQQQQQQQQHPSNSSGQTFENFHLDPQDFQNFLLINPPLTEYSSHYYMNLSNSNNGMNNNVSNRYREPNGYSHSHPQFYSNNNNRPSTDIDPTHSNQPNVPLSSQPISPPISSNDQILNPNVNYQNLNSDNNNNNINNNNNNNNDYLDLQTFNTQSNMSSSAGRQQQNTQPLQQQNNYNYNQQQSLNYQNWLDLDTRFDDQQQLPLPTRRLSISNGQIGQISMMVHSQMQLLNSGDTTNTSDTSKSIDSTDNQIEQQLQQLQQQQQPDTHQSQLQDQQQIPSNIPNQENKIEVDNNGVPTRALLYNNEVIFNPNGPIPGTNAWKRAKILERNRIAASKCRAKKKNLQKKLQEDVDILTLHNDGLKSMLVDMRERVLRYCESKKIDITDVLMPEKDEKDDDVINLKQEHTDFNTGSTKNLKKRVDKFVRDGWV